MASDARRRAAASARGSRRDETSSDAEVIGVSMSSPMHAVTARTGAISTRLQTKCAAQTTGGEVFGASEKSATSAGRGLLPRVRTRISATRAGAMVKALRGTTGVCRRCIASRQWTCSSVAPCPALIAEPPESCSLGSAESTEGGPSSSPTWTSSPCCGHTA